MIVPGGIWDSQVLVAFFTVTVPLLAGQWWQSRKAKQDATKSLVQQTATADAAGIAATEAKSAASTIVADGQSRDGKIDGLIMKAGQIHDLTNHSLDEQKNHVTELRWTNKLLRVQLDAAGIKPANGSDTPPPAPTG